MESNDMYSKNSIKWLQKKIKEKKKIIEKYDFYYSNFKNSDINNIKRNCLFVVYQEIKKIEIELNSRLGKI